MKPKRQPFIRNNRYYNSENEPPKGSFFEAASLFFKHFCARDRRSAVKKKVERWICSSVNISDQKRDPVITWLGHATFLIQVGGVAIMTDPIFGQPSLLYRRMLPVGICPDMLPHIGYVLLSHNHRDHMDAPSLLWLKKRFPQAVFLVPAGDKRWFDRRSFSTVYEHTWWQERVFPLADTSNDRLTFTYTPAYHWSQRGLFDRNRSLWGSWMIECKGVRIYFGGDTAYSEHFSEIRESFLPIDIALLPIAPCEPKHWISHAHLDAGQAGQAFLDLGAPHMIPMHWGTFPFGSDRFEYPMQALDRWCSASTDLLCGKRVHCVKVGQSIAAIRDNHGDLTWR